ncbi:uncharacterized protein E0L32_011292 [Thyridium curvatum]|uniref:Uncharacterized protein n=1 Tax=Thyridium curvatum TaxID=1093900 RepID=A0A507BQA8_9PEZI|nr:uncharacterized protein E0L32_011292 [Thyridium curvatum]TPX19048.1 hypothetical protein E0L32_011292 [Thyridium curvatum]
MAHCLQRLAWAMVGVPPKQALAPSAALPERNVPPIVVEPPGSPAPRRSVTADERFRKCLSNASTLTNTPAGPSPIIRPSEPETHNATPPLPPLPEPTPPTPTTRTRTKALDVLISNPVLYLSILAIPMIGLPIAVTTGNTAPIDTIVLFLLWTTFLATQRKSRSTPVLASQPRWRTFLSAALNAVLWTALGMIAYCALKSALSHHPSASLIDTLTSLSTGTTLSDLIIGSGTRPSMGAGDVAVSILDAGIVSWGLKLFECRAQLTSPSGVTTVVTALAAAALNVVCGPLLARALGLRLPGWCLAFAARSVTLALAGPAMGSLGGDVGVNAAMVVFSGIVFQVGLGLGVGGWLRGVFAATTRAWATGRGSDGGGGGGRKDRDVEKGAAVRLPTAATAGGDDGRLRDDEHQEDEEEEEEEDADSPLTVATGVMVGVNGAAMGTAHLYDADSRAAPYAALSMTVFGVMTVVMTSSDRLVHWLVAQVAS